MRNRKQNLPRGIDRLKSGLYRARLTWQGRQLTIGYYEALGDAKAALAIARGRVARETFVPPAEVRRRRKAAEAEEEARRVTVAEWADRWLDRLRELDRSPGTLASYASTLRVHILPMLGDMRLDEVTADHVKGLTADVTPAVGRNVVRTISAMFNAAALSKVGGVVESPVAGVQVRKPKRAHDDGSNFAALAEVRAIAELMPPNLRAAVWLAALCGLRQGEVLGLQRHDLDLTHGDAWVHVRRQWLSKASPPAYASPKAGSEGRVAIPGTLAALLRDHMARVTADADDAPVFATTSGRPPATRKRPVSQGTFDRYWRAAREEVKPGLHFHALRHVALTLYAQQGATGRETQARGRHSSPEVAMLYQERSDGRDRALTDKLDGGLADVVPERIK